MLGMAILAIFVGLAIRQQGEDRRELAAGIRVAACETANEFRSFMGDYLDSQVGVPIEEVDGFDELPVELQQSVVALAPVLDANRASDAAYAVKYRAKFPIVDCTTLS